VQFCVVHNIPSPYRLHLFRVLSRQLGQRGISFRVHFMAKGHSDRPSEWSRSIGDIGFEHLIHKDRAIRIGTRTVHWNPTIIRHLRQQSPEWLLVGGPWDSLTGAAAACFAPRTRAIAWFEANTQTPGRLGFPFGAVKRWLLRRFDLFAVPGVDGEAYVRLLFGSGIPTVPIAVLPNIVDESAFSKADEVSQARGQAFFRSIGVPSGRRIALWPARMIPAKGILEMLRVLSGVATEEWSVVLVGEGPLKTVITSTIKEFGLTTRVLLSPYVEYDRMPSLYHAADLFLLPSLHDPNPLSVVEAMHAGLPILVSRRIGNFSEALEEGVNGWAIDPERPDHAAVQVCSAFNSSRGQLRKMGECSRIRARDQWGSESAVARFLDVVLRQ